MKVAFLGLGAMGARMAARAVAAGLDVVVWNRSPRTVEGAASASTPAEAARGADVVLTMLTDIAASEAVWESALQGLGPDAVAVECSTLTPAYSRALAERVGATGAAYLEAPVVGTRPHADNGILRVLCGGDAAVFDTVRPVLASFGTPVLVGPVGAAMTLKLAINSLFAGQVVLLAEALSMLRTVEVGTDEALGILEGTPVFPPVLAGVATLLRSGNDDPLFPVDLVAKDLGYAGSLAELPLIEAIAQRYVDAGASGLGGRNIHAVGQLYG